MKGMIIFFLLLITQQASADELWRESIRVVRDDSRGVTCWYREAVAGGGISCLPDSSLQQQSTLSSKQDHDGPTPAAAPTLRSPEERFQL